MFNSTVGRREALEQRRQLHARIARSRRRINGHVSHLKVDGLLRKSWRQKIQEHPVVALATAAGTGMLLAQLLSRGSVTSKLGDGLAKWLSGGAAAGFMKHVERFFATVDNSNADSASEVDHV